MATDFGAQVPDGVAALSVQLRDLSEGFTLQISGDLDFLSARELTQVVEAIQFDGRRHLVLDLTGLVFCDAGGVAALLRAHRSVSGAGGQLLVRGASGLPRRVLAITGADRLLHLDDAAGSGGRLPGGV
jgi:anti-sigma B factor antagonist